jgi:hypothetical protein
MSSHPDRFRAVVIGSGIGGLASAPPGFMPWFDVPQRKTADVTVVFGHWAALGLLRARADFCRMH